MKLKALISHLLRILFKIPLIKKKYYGIHNRLIKPLGITISQPQIVKLDNGLLFELHINDWIQEQLFYLGYYERAEENFLKLYLPYEGTFIDIGANIGVHSLTAAQLVGERGKVISFEPFSINYDRLIRNISLNNCNNIQTEKKALSSKTGVLEISYDSNSSNLGSVSIFSESNAGTESIKSIKLDDYLSKQNLTGIEIIKIDIEGAEYEALKGMTETLSTFSPLILIEIDENILNRTQHNNEAVINLLKQFGYTQYYINQDGTLSSINNRKDSYNFVFRKDSV